MFVGSCSVSLHGVSNRWPQIIKYFKDFPVFSSLFSCGILTYGIANLRRTLSFPFFSLLEEHTKDQVSYWAPPADSKPTFLCTLDNAALFDC